MQVRIHQGGELRLGPLGLQRADSENDTKSREHFQAQKSKRYNQRYGQSNQSNQSNAINDMTNDTVRAIKAIKAIKAMQSTIRPERYDQSDMVSDTIRMNP